MATLYSSIILFFWHLLHFVRYCLLIYKSQCVISLRFIPPFPENFPFFFAFWIISLTRNNDGSAALSSFCPLITVRIGWPSQPNSSLKYPSQIFTISFSGSPGFRFLVVPTIYVFYFILVTESKITKSTYM